MNLSDVFGVSKQRVLSYLERAAVDGYSVKALASDKHIIVYGSSKQGKTSLVDKHLPYEKNVLVSCTPEVRVDGHLQVHFKIREHSARNHV